MHRHLSAPILQCTAALCEAQSPRTAKHSSVLMTRTPAAVHSKQCQQQSECGRRSHEERLWHGRSCARYCHHHALSCQVVIAVVRVVAAVAAASTHRGAAISTHIAAARADALRFSCGNCHMQHNSLNRVNIALLLFIFCMGSALVRSMSFLCHPPQSCLLLQMAICYVNR
eukprot:1158444-Pelagomonas_calceolata.AAC.3